MVRSQAIADNITRKGAASICEQPTQLGSKERDTLPIWDAKLLVNCLPSTMASIQALPSPYVTACRSLDANDRVTDADQGEGKGSPHSGSSATSDREAREAEQIAQELQVGLHLGSGTGSSLASLISMQPAPSRH